MTRFAIILLVEPQVLPVLHCYISFDDDMHASQFSKAKRFISHRNFLGLSGVNFDAELKKI